MFGSSVGCTVTSATVGISTQPSYHNNTTIFSIIFGKNTFVSGILTKVFELEWHCATGHLLPNDELYGALSIAKRLILAAFGLVPAFCQQCKVLGVHW